MQTWLTWKNSTACRSMKLKGQLQADIPTADPDFLNANIVLHQFRMADGKQDIAIDSVMVIATATAQRNTIAIKSPILDATVDGKYKLTQIGDAITNSVSRYYDFNPKARKTKTQPQLLAFNAGEKQPGAFSMLPELKGFEPMVINGRYNSQNDTIILSAAMPKIIYGTNKLTNAIVKIDTKDEALVYNIFIDDLKCTGRLALCQHFGIDQGQCRGLHFAAQGHQGQRPLLACRTNAQRKRRYRNKACRQPDAQLRGLEYGARQPHPLWPKRHLCAGFCTQQRRECYYHPIAIGNTQCTACLGFQETQDRDDYQYHTERFARDERQHQREYGY
jgi:hypothetical protein